MNTKFDIDDPGGERIVYVKPVLVEDLPSEIRDQAGDAEQIYAVHSPTGKRLALVKDRELAFWLARENDYAPVNVH